jgi:hypothetical protein
MKSATQRLLSWVNSLDVDSPLVARESAGQVGSAPSSRDPPRWRPILAREDTSDPFQQGDRSPISLLSMESPAPESSTCDPECRQERTEEFADSSVPSNHDPEHEQATFAAVPPPKGQEATESQHESSLNLQQDAQDPPDSTRSDDSQAEPRDPPEAHSGGEGEEHSHQRDRHEESPGEATDSALEPAAYVGDGQHVAQPRGEKDNGNDEDERIDGDEEDAEEQAEQVEEEESASSGRCVRRNNDGKPEVSSSSSTDIEQKSSNGAALGSGHSYKYGR